MAVIDLTRPLINLLRITKMITKIQHIFFSLTTVSVVISKTSFYGFSG